MNEMEQAAGLAATPNYQYAKRVGNQLFTAGQVPHDANADLVGIGDPAAQTTQCLVNLLKLMEVHGFDQKDIKKLTIYVVGEHANLMTAWSTIEKWFDYNIPPATLLGTYQLAYENQLVEIDAIIIREE